MADTKARAGEGECVCVCGDEMLVVVLLTVVFTPALEAFRDHSDAEPVDTSQYATFEMKLFSFCALIRRIFGIYFLSYYLQRFVDDPLFSWVVMIYCCVC